MAKAAKRPSRKVAPKKKVGRPNFTFRMSDALRANLEAVAEVEQRSLSEEVEIRLERSFANARALDEALELALGSAPAAFLAILAHVINDAGRLAGFYATGSAAGSADWLENPAAFAEVSAAIGEVLQAFRPAGEPSQLSTSFAVPLGIGLARGALEAIKNPARGGTIGDWAAPLRPKLGAIAQRLQVDAQTIVLPMKMPRDSKPAVVATLSVRKDGAK